MYGAFMTLEENEGYLSQEVRPPASILGCCGGGREASVARRYSMQENPYDGPKEADWRSYIQRTPAYVERLQGSMRILDKALVSLRAAQPKTTSSGRYELEYLINRTEVYRDAMQAYITIHQGFAAFDRAFQHKHRLPHHQFVEALEASLRQCEDAKRRVTAATVKFARIVDHPADLEILYHLNVRAVLGFDLACQWLRQVVNFHEGKPYTQHVPFERLYPFTMRMGHALQEEM